MKDAVAPGRAAWAVISIALSAWCLLWPSGARADLTQHDELVEATLIGSVSDELDTYVGTRTPTLQIRVLEPGASVQCRAGDFLEDGPCGVQQTSGCPAVQCWTYAPTLAEGLQEIYVDEESPSGLFGYLQFQFTVDATAPDTSLTVPLHGSYHRLNLFDQTEGESLQALDDYSAEDALQCSLSLAHGPPAAWGGCREKQLPALRPHATYRLLARAVDILGRPDPTPVEYVFSPTPCSVRPLGGQAARHILEHGLKVRVHCVQPTSFEMQLRLSLFTVRHYYHGIAPPPLSPQVEKSTRKEGETRAFTVPVQHLSPVDVKLILGYSRHQKGYRVELGLYQLGWGAPAFVPDVLR